MPRGKGSRLHYIGSTVSPEGPVALFKSCVEVEEGDCHMVQKDDGGGDSAEGMEENIVGMVPVDSSQVKEGQPVYRLKGDGVHFEKVAVKRGKPGGRSGPIQVSTAAYRTRWEETFGKNGVN
jgi:hypothetical protein